MCCPNSPYRDYARAHAEEICRLFDFEGLRFDMTFWPTVCYCPHCQRRFAAEVGGELPRMIDWDDPRWVAFQRRREAWLSEFAGDDHGRGQSAQTGGHAWSTRPPPTPSTGVLA